MHFQTRFGQPPTITAHAPGRVNLIGEHTDYNGGYVLPTPILQTCRVELRPRADRTVRAWSANVGGAIESFDLGQEQKGRGWLDYLQGVMSILAADGHDLRGFDVLFHSTVPLGSGLSSSAAMNVAAMRALREVFALRLDDLHLAVLCRRVENEFVGAQVGIMDPMACSLGESGSALFIDTQRLTFDRIPLLRGADLVVINSGIAHRHAAGDYNTRRAECNQAAELLGVQSLRELGPDDLPRLASLPDVLARRVRHVVTENERVLATVAAMQTGDLEHMGWLFRASHVSQRDDYQVSIPEIDLLVELCHQEPAVLGARLTGGGFGGSIVCLARDGQGSPVAVNVVRAYVTQTGQSPAVYLLQAC